MHRSTLCEVRLSQVASDSPDWHTSQAEELFAEPFRGRTRMFEPGNVYLLLVDDDVEYRNSVARRFVRRGFHVQEASSGEEALDLAERRQFDIAILDMVMPGLSGLDVLEKLRQRRTQSAKSFC